ncbi:hypothetical protein [Paraburkholderia sp. DHOC27]|uniref:hypothetical protein n=1 Tax=Paraburkholderia sp. DHOC27 TaxID=2303330 RepID=UPI0011C10021|nr:hypothetical protein [Paraburkholderia sp. DHOC27]
MGRVHRHAIDNEARCASCIGRSVRHAGFCITRTVPVVRCIIKARDHNQLLEQAAKNRPYRNEKKAPNAGLAKIAGIFFCFREFLILERELHA